MKTFAFAIAAVLATSAYAAEPFAVATGDSKGGSTYSQMYRELARKCTSNQLPLVEQETNGSATNVALLTENRVNAAIVQTDMLFFMKMTDPDKVTNVRTLFALHPEELHFIARADVKKEGGVLGFGGTKVSFNTVNDLKGRPIGAVGGSAVSARIFSAQSQLGLQVVEYNTNDELRNALLKGDVDSILVVGGAPHKLVQSLDARYRILPVDPATAQKVGGVYAGTKLSYPNLGAAGIPSVATQANFVTRLYRSPVMQSNLAALRACFERELPEIQDAKGTHPKWQLVDSVNKGKWSWYDLPAAK